MSELKIIKSIVSQLFDGELEFLPEHFSTIDPIIFSEEIIKEFNNRHEPIKITVNHCVDQSESLLKKIEEARKKLTGENFDKFWECFTISLDTTFFGNTPWTPRVLPNGALLVRNNHMSVCLSESIKGHLSVKSKNLKKDLSLISSFVKSSLEEDDDFSFSILHRDEEGFEWTKEVPHTLSEVGQTIIFISIKLLEDMLKSGKFEEDNILFNPQILNIAKISKSGHCVLRVFKRATFLYSTERASDSVDTILENYSYYMGETTIDEISINKQISYDIEFIKKEIQETIRKTKNVDIYNTELFKSNSPIRMFINEKIYTQYTTEKALQINSFEPIFGRYFDRPATYKDNIEFWNFSEIYNGNIFVIKNLYSLINGFSNFNNQLKDTISKIANLMPNTLIKVHLPLEKLNYINENDIFEHETKPYYERIEQILNNFKEQFKKEYNNERLAKYQKRELAEKEFLNKISTEINFDIIFILKSQPNIKNCHDFFIECARLIGEEIFANIPSYGFSQQYYANSIGIGNYKQFLTEEEQNNILN